MASNFSRQAVENAIMKALIRKMTDVLIDVLDHAPNLSAWKASYFLVKSLPAVIEKPEPNGEMEKRLMFASRYRRIVECIEEAALFLEGNNLINAITSLDRIDEVGVFSQDKR